MPTREPRNEDTAPRLTHNQERAGAALDKLCAEFTNERSVLAQSERLAEGKKLYVARYPETARGAAPGKAGGGKVAKMDTVATFAVWIAKRISTSPRQVRRLVHVGEGIDRSVRRKIHGTKLANQTRDLEDVARIKNAKQQMEVVAAYRAKPNGDLVAFRKTLRKFVKKEKPTPKAPWPTDAHLIEVHRPIEVKLPIGKLVVELLHSADGFSLLFGDPKSRAVQRVGGEVAVNAPTDAVARPEEGETDDEPLAAKAHGPAWATLMTASTDAASQEDREALSGVHGGQPEALRLKLPDSADLAAAVYGEHAPVAAKLLGKKSTAMRRVASEGGLTPLNDDPLAVGQDVIVAFGNSDSGVTSVAVGRVAENHEVPSELYALGHGGTGQFACRLSLHDPALGKMLGIWVPRTARSSRAPRTHSTSAPDSSSDDEPSEERAGSRLESERPRREWENTILVGDCGKKLPTLPAECVSTIITDPPYGLGTKQPTPEAIERYLGGGTLDLGSDFMGMKWGFPTLKVWRECLRLLKPGGVVACFAGTRTVDLISAGLAAAGFESEGTLLWIRASGWPKSRNALKPAHEPILIFRKPGGVNPSRLPEAPFFYCHRASQRERTLGGRVPNPHPTVKPLEVLRWLVRLLVPEGGFVLDPYAGSGTTALAALAEGRSFVLVERDRKYVSLARRRIEVARETPSLLHSSAKVVRSAART